MIDVKELRVGNLLEDDSGLIGKVNELRQSDSDSPYDVTLEMESGMYCEYQIEDLEPIPITEELLVNFGLEHEYIEFVGNVYAIDTNVGNISLSIDKGIRTLDIYGVELESVHQLQNLFLCLTGYELIIE